jgi:hypothetical protein
MKKSLRMTLKMLGIVVIKHENIKILSNKLDIYRNLKHSLELVTKVPISQRNTYQDLFLKNFQYSCSRVLQDVFALTVLGSKENGYFVEASASDGLDSSNTYLLEKKFGWNGLLIEPSKMRCMNMTTATSKLRFGINAAIGALFSIESCIFPQ